MVDSPVKPSAPVVFIVGIFLTTNSISLTGITLFRLSIFLEWTLVVCIFQGIFSIKWKLSKYRHKVFNNIPYCPFSMYRFCSDVASLIPDVGKVCLLSFFLISLVSSLAILLIFYWSWLHWFSPFSPISLIFHFHHVCFLSFVYMGFNLLFPPAFLCLNSSSLV